MMEQGGSRLSCTETEMGTRNGYGNGDRKRQLFEILKVDLGVGMFPSIQTGPYRGRETETIRSSRAS